MEISGGNYSFKHDLSLRSYSVMLVDLLTIRETYNINVSAMNTVHVGESTPFQLELNIYHVSLLYLCVNLVEHFSQLKINDFILQMVIIHVYVYS